ncbi:hypothetical protein [Thiothrix lacustris]|uniref:Glutamate-ammonia-ligase adenylyltransferase n=1 Tax=Thiothrix lacustris TaxID=525917 RepID=A0ABY9MQG0_9GAMM|nr:hypothetical protein [Thiothrix lacustris]WML90889.1 hypothetical protein RCF98_00720 [Thiothrix lacustris]WMP17423.1 hypothetical protein RCS87_18860 [Thiothrix lacustris]
MSNKQQLLIVAALFLGLGLLWFLKQDPALNHLNTTLQADSELQSYPYQFRALKVENGVATLTTPRSPEVSVLQFLKIAQPKLDTSNPDSPTMIAAQKALSRIQEKAGKLAKAQEGITEVQWEIDRSWYASHGLIVE